MKKALRIILLLLLVIAIFIAGAWYLSRKKAVEEGRSVPSFREFIGIGTKQPTQEEGDGLSPDENQQNNGEQQTPGSTNTGGDTDTLYNENDVWVSEFTDGPMAPADPVDEVIPETSGGSSSEESETDTEGSTETPPIAQLPTAPTTPPGQVPTAGCEDDDITIAFTPEEIARLNALQNRFYAVASGLHSDADVRTELANYDNFKLRADKTEDMYAYCTSTAPRITGSPYTTRVPTPFWRDASRDKNGYMLSGRPTNLAPLSTLASSRIDPRDVSKTQVIIQKIFALNLW